MLEGIEEDQIPKNEEDFLFMLDMFGADWTGPCITFSPNQREESRPWTTGSTPTAACW